MKYFKNINLFQEAKLAHYRKNEDELWEEPTPVDMGIAPAEQLIKDFDVRTDPERISLNHPDEVVFGVRSKMMDGPFRGTGNNILSANFLHNDRVISRLRHIYSHARETYQHIISEEFQRRTEWGYSKWNWLKSKIGYRAKIEKDIAGEFFKFNFERGETCESFRDDIYQQIRKLEDPKNGTFLDANNEPINLVDQNATNEYTVATGDTGAFRNERVIVRWHDDDFFKIRSKLERAGLWGEFSRSTPDNRKVRQFIHLKFKLSLVDKVAAEEKTKLNNDRYNAQRLQSWLDNDKTTQALHDPEMQTFIDDNNIRRDYATFEELENRNPDLHREFTNKIEELREKNKEKTLEYYLSRILPAEELDNIHDSLEARTMLAYLQGQAQDPEQGMNIRNYLKKLAGVKEDTGLSDEDLKELDENIDLLKYFGKTYGNSLQQRDRLEREISSKTSSLPNGKARFAAQKQIDELTNKRDSLDQEIVNKIWDFLTLLHAKKSKNGFKDFIGSPSILHDTDLKDRPTGNFENYIKAFNNYWGKRDFFMNFEKTSNELEKNKEEFEKKKADNEDLEPTKMDSRGLLASLMRLDLQRHGVTDSERQKKHALFAAELAIARLETSEIYADENQHIVDSAETGETVAGVVRGTSDLLSSTRFFTPVLSAKDAIEHVVDTDPDLLIFSDITHASTRKDLKDIIEKYGVGPAKLKEFIAKLGACIKGIEISPAGTSLFSRLPAKLGKLFGFAAQSKEKSLGVRMLSCDVPLVTNLIHTLMLLSAEYSAKNYYNEAKEQAKMDPSKTFDEHYLDMLKQQTSDMRELNQAIEEDLERPDNPLKTHLDFQYMNRKGNEALDQVEHIDDIDEQNQELIRQGVAPRELTRGFISLRTRRFFRKAARVGLKGLSLPFYIPYGIGLGAKAVGKYWWKEIFMTEGTKKGGRLLREHWKAVAETPQHIVGIPFFAASMILSWPTRKFRELNNKLKE